MSINQTNVHYFLYSTKYYTIFNLRFKKYDVNTKEDINKL